MAEATIIEPALLTCNTPRGIEGYLARGLRGLNELRATRLHYGYEAKVRLEEFCVLGRFWFDSCGNCGRITGNNVPAELYRVNKYDPESACPSVMTRHETLLFLRGDSLSWSHGPAFPPHDATCDTCGKTWTLADCHDVIVTDVRDGHLYRHAACARRKRDKRQRKEFYEAFAAAGFPPEDVNLITIPNQYWGADEAPWYLAQVADGHEFQLGWRKRVISISWEKSGKDLSALFVSEDVTKDRFGIHAWGYGKLAEYLSKIVPALSGVP